MKPEIKHLDSVHSFMLKKERANGEKHVVEMVDDHFAINNTMEKWEWDVLKMNILGSIKRANIPIEVGD